MHLQSARYLVKKIFKNVKHVWNTRIKDTVMNNTVQKNFKVILN